MALEQIWRRLGWEEKLRKLVTTVLFSFFCQEQSLSAGPAHLAEGTAGAHLGDLPDCFQ